MTQIDNESHFSHCKLCITQHFEKLARMCSPMNRKSCVGCHLNRYKRSMGH